MTDMVGNCLLARKCSESIHCDSPWLFRDALVISMLLVNSCMDHRSHIIFHASCYVLIVHYQRLQNLTKMSSVLYSQVACLRLKQHHTL